MKRTSKSKLTLSRESIRNLQEGSLSQVAGGIVITTTKLTRISCGDLCSDVSCFSDCHCPHTVVTCHPTQCI
jgi:hypothetical protein